MANYLFESGACALDFGEDGFGGSRPHVGVAQAINTRQWLPYCPAAATDGQRLGHIGG
jgi:hypothetical protein